MRMSALDAATEITPKPAITPAPGRGPTTGVAVDEPLTGTARQTDSGVSFAVRRPGATHLKCVHELEIVHGMGQMLGAGAIAEENQVWLCR